MASTRRSPPADGALAPDRLPGAVAAALAEEVPAGAGVAVAFSGGRDSLALLDAAATAAAAQGRALAALHVHHGLSPHADRWLAFCERTCAARGVPLFAQRIEVGPRPVEGIEAAARALRYQALAGLARRAGVAHVLLAHHQDDQAETLLLQLGRGAGPHGLRGMPRRREHDGIAWLRPLLDLPRDDLEAHLAARGLAWVDDDSNADARFRRNAIRTTLVPAWRAVLPGYPGTLGRAAQLQGEAARLADDLAALDAGALGADGSLERERLAALPQHRARNLLRWFLRERGLRPPSAARLDAMLATLRTAAQDARVRLAHDGAQIGLHRGRIVVHAPPPAPFAVAWRGESALALPHGTLAFLPAVGEGLALERLSGRTLSVRSREGGERLALGPGRPHRSLKHLLQEAGMPPWERAGLPLVFVDGALAGVPGIGIAPEFHAASGRAGLRLHWRAGPGDPASVSGRSIL